MIVMTGLVSRARYNFSTVSSPLNLILVVATEFTSYSIYNNYIADI